MGFEGARGEAREEFGDILYVACMLDNEETNNSSNVEKGTDAGAGKSGDGSSCSNLRMERVRFVS